MQENKMKPILFNTEMVRAILDGRKTVTRRNPFQFQMKDGYNPEWSGYSLGEYYTGHIETGACLYSRGSHGVWGVRSNVVKPKYNIGDVLYVRETWQHGYELDGNDQIIEGTEKYYYAAGPEDVLPNFTYWLDEDTGEHKDNMPWKPSLHMPKEAARIFLRVKAVKVERLQDIDKYWSNYDKEGMRNPETENISIVMQERFISIWNSTVKKTDIDRYGWQANPWVWVIEFERISKEEAIQSPTSTS